jgi:RNA polymerase sigma-70 factor (ECF subfamily)
VDSERQSTTRHSLLARVRDLSDAAAWQDFVECYTPGIYSWSCRFGLQESDAADATQTVLMKLVEALRSFDYNPERGRFRGWLKTVTRNVATDVMRTWRDRGIGGSTILPWDGLEQSDPADALLLQVENAYREELLRRAGVAVRMKVKPKTWDAWDQTCNVQRPAAVVARELGVTVADIYVARSRILKMLREEVQRLEAEDEEGTK